MKKHFLSIINLAVVALATIFFSPGVASADSLELRCRDFNDVWFMDMTYGFGYCNPPNLRDVDITTAAANFKGHLKSGGWRTRGSGNRGRH